MTGAGWDAWWTWISCPSKTIPESSHDPSNATPRSSPQQEAKITNYWSVVPLPSLTHWQNLEVPVTLIGQITQSDVVFTRKSEPVEGLSGWNHFA